MSGITVCERYVSRAEADKDLLARAKHSIEVLKRAPEEEDDPTLIGKFIIMDRLDCWDLLKRAKAALAFFYPHFRIHNEIISRANEDWDYRYRAFFRKLFSWDWNDRNGRALVEKHEKMMAAFDRMLGQVSSADNKTVEIETKIVRSARNWIAWHDSEIGRCNSQGVYR